MNIGIWVPMTFEQRPPPQGQYNEFFRAVEGLGFHSVWVTDSVLNRTHLFDDLTVLTWAAAVTTRLRVGTSVMLLNLRHPVRVARAAASLDVLSAGRLTLGVSMGGHSPWYEALGVDMRTRVNPLRRERRPSATNVVGPGTEVPGKVFSGGGCWLLAQTGSARRHSAVVRRPRGSGA